MFKILVLYDKNPWRNNQSKLTTFDLILQRPHSALMPATSKTQSSPSFRIDNSNREKSVGQRTEQILIFKPNIILFTSSGKGRSCAEKAKTAGVKRAQKRRAEQKSFKAMLQCCFCVWTCICICVLVYEFEKMMKIVGTSHSDG